VKGYGKASKQCLSDEKPKYHIKNRLTFIKSRHVESLENPFKQINFHENLRFQNSKIQSRHGGSKGIDTGQEGSSDQCTDQA